MDRQAELGETLVQHRKDSLGVTLIRQRQREVIREPDQFRFAGQHRCDLAVEPLIQHIVQVDVGQQRLDRIALRSALVRVRHRTVFQHPADQCRASVRGELAVC